MKISNGEKLILIMLSEVYDAVKVDGDIDSNFIRSAIHNDQTWGIPWKYSGIPFEKEETPEIVKEVLDILEMWSAIEHSYSQLTDADKQIIEKEAEPFGKDPKFKGFDGNNESEHMSTASFLVNDLERFEEFKGRYLNAHCPTLDAYGRMLFAFEKIKKNIGYNSMNAKQIIAVLNEKRHPEHR